MPSDKPETTLQEAADRIRRSGGTPEDAKIIDQAFQKAKWDNIRELRQQTRRRTKWLR